VAPAPTPTLRDDVLGALGGRPACVVVRRAGRDVLMISPERVLVPASTQKLLVAAAALDVLGPQHRFETSLEAEAPAAHGVLGAVWLVGGGDPLLATPEYAAWLAASPRWRELSPTPMAHLADALVRAGVREVGAVRADAGRHADAGVLDVWKAGSLADADITPVSALTVNRGMAPWHPTPTPVGDPPLHAASELTRLLRERGVTVTADPEAGVAPTNGVRMAAVTSAPLADVLTGMLRASDNLGAEMLTREIGLRARGTGSTAAGTAAVRDSLVDRGVDVRGLRMVDGSGLSGHNRASCRTLAGGLEAEPRLARMLAVAGTNGTLRTRLVGTPLAGRLRGKTGWISGTVGFAGRLDDATVVMLQNGVPSLAVGRQAEEQVLHLVAERAGR
jgi:D-alanyl-D-alanine carboxypeptidase/D-alanyl-D-alanine-endopeptidase (penicillin-binding protein 4)